MFFCIHEYVPSIRDHCDFYWETYVQKTNVNSAARQTVEQEVSLCKCHLFPQKQVFWHQCFLTVYLPQLRLLFVPLPSFFSLSSSQSQLWGLRLIVLRGVEGIWVYWIAETESENDKASFFLFAYLFAIYLYSIHYLKHNYSSLQAKRWEIRWNSDPVCEVGKTYGGKKVHMRKNMNQKPVCSLSEYYTVYMWDVM